MRNKKTRILITLSIFILLVIIFFSIPIFPLKQITNNQEPMAIIFNTVNLETGGLEKNGTWKLNTTSRVYDMKENEGTNIKERINETLKNMKCYHTPYTMVYNLMDKTRVREETQEKHLTIILYSDSTGYVLEIVGDYIILDGNYYSLGWKGNEKGQEVVEKIENIMEEAGEYLQEN